VLLDAILGETTKNHSPYGRATRRPADRAVPPSRRAVALGGVAYLDEHPFFAPQTRWVLANVGVIDPSSIDEYIAFGGYRAFSQAIRRMTPLELCKQVEESACEAGAAAGSSPARSGGFALARRPTRSSSSATPTRVIRARSWTGRSSRATRTAYRGHGHRRLRHRRRKGHRVHPRRVSAGGQAPQGGDRSSP